MNIEFAERFNDITGSEIRKIFALLSDPEMISLAGGNPSPKSFPNAEISEIVDDLVSSIGETVFQYGDTPGIGPLLDYFRTNDPELYDGDDVITLTGSSQGIDFATRTLLNPGDPIIVESPTFLGAIQTFRIGQADIHTVPVESDGVDINVLEDAVRKYRPKFFYIIPTFQNPSGKTTSEEKRKAVYEICAKHGVLVLEDDPYKELRYSGSAVPSVKSFDRAGIVISLRSFSKTVSPGLRLGTATARKEIIAKFNLCKQAADVHSVNLSQYIVYEYIKRGLLEPHIREICDMYRIQRDCMMDAVASEFPDSVHVQKPDGGLFAWVELPEHINGRDIFNKCVERRVAFVPGEPFYADNPKNNTMRLNFSMPTAAQIEKGISIIGEVIKENL